MALDIGPRDGARLRRSRSRARARSSGTGRWACSRRSRSRRARWRSPRRWRRCKRADGRRRRRLGGGGQRGGRGRQDQAHLDGRRRLARVHRGQDAARASRRWRSNSMSADASRSSAATGSCTRPSPSRSSSRPRSRTRSGRCATSRWRWRRCSPRCYAVAKRLEGSAVALAAQDCFWEDQGAWTGEVSAQLLKDVGCSYVHRRALGAAPALRRARRGGEPEGAAALAQRARPDRLRRRDAGGARRGRDLRRASRAQLDGGLAEFTAEEMRETAGHRLRAGLGDRHRPHRDAAAGARSACIHSRQAVASSSATSPTAVRIQYGGSVKPDNARALMAQAGHRRRAGGRRVAESG